LFHLLPALLSLPSFPTRRSSDLSASMQALNTVTAMAFINSFISELLTDAINSSKFRLILSWVISNLSYYFVIFANYIVTQEVGCDPLLHNYTDTTFMRAWIEIFFAHTKNSILLVVFLLRLWIEILYRHSNIT